tara:strand:+ start:1385 stop:3412 length:2028 start_codon:yes stop_codon:yes gene_type:complete
MGNYTKSFNFRNGLQVDDSNFIVNDVGLVGIGTTRPEKTLDIRGNTRVSGVSSLTTVNVSTAVSMGSTIRLDSVSGIISATKFVGDASGLTNIVAIATDGWIANTGTLSTTAKIGIGSLSPISQLDVLGDTRIIGFTTLSGITTSIGTLLGNQFAVTGVSTFHNNIDANAHTDLTSLAVSAASTFTGVVDANGGAGISSIKIGITGTNEIDTEVGGLTLDSATGQTTIDDDLVVSGILTATDFKGANNSAADFPRGLTGTAVTISNELFVGSGATVGFGTTVFFNDEVKASFGTSQDLQIFHDPSGDSIIRHVTSGVSSDLHIESSNAIHIGKVGLSEKMASFEPDGSVSLKHNNVDKLVTVSSGATIFGRVDVAILNGGGGLSTHSGALRYGHNLNDAPLSTRKSLDIINFDAGNINYYLNYDNKPAVIGEGDFKWLKGKNNNKLMTLTGSTGRLGVGTTVPDERLHVDGSAKVTGDMTLAGDLNVTGTGSTITASKFFGDVQGFVTGDINGNLFANSGVSTFRHVQVISGVVTCSDFQAGKIGVGTSPDKIGNDIVQIEVTPSNKVFVNEIGSIGIKTTSIHPQVQIDASQTSTIIGAVGVGTTRPLAAVDFAGAGSTSAGYLVDRQYMYPPLVDNTRQGQLTGMQKGAIIFNIEANKLRFYNGSNWIDVNET